MRILVNGNPIYPGPVTLRESVFEYCPILSFTLNTPAYAEVFTLEIQDKLDFVPVKIEQVNALSYQYTCYPKSYIDFLQILTSPINLIGTLEELLNALAVGKFDLLHKTQETHWIYASMRGKTLIERLTQHVKAVDGGCPTFHFGMDGTLLFSDILSECLSEACGYVSGTITKFGSSMSFENLYPGTVRFHFFDENTYESQKSTYLEGSGNVNLYRYVVSEDRKELEIRKMQSQFWRKYVANTLMTMENTQNSVVSPGLKVRNTNTNDEFVCITTVSSFESGGVQTTLELFPCVKTNQVL